MKVTLVQGDITTQEVDAIVNAANCPMLGGGGVDGAIHRAAGPELLEACRRFPVLPGDLVREDDLTQAVLRRGRALDVRCPVGHARLTPGFNLPAKFVIHTVGPIYDPENVERCGIGLESAYGSSLQLARMVGCRTVALPAISCGVYGYPLDEAAAIAIEVAADHSPYFDEIRFVLFMDDVVAAFQKAAVDFQKIIGGEE